jgi:hypothetical protein
MSEPFPSSIIVSRFRFDLNQNKAITESMFTRQRQVISLAGGTSDRWEGVIETAQLVTRAEIRTMDAFVTRVGLYGRFTIKHPAYDGPESGESLGLVKGAGQSGTTLLVDGFTPSIQVAEEGDYFQVRDEFKRLTANATSNGSGEVTFAFEPALRVSPADNDPVNLGTPVMLLELTTMPSHEVIPPRRAEPYILSFQEALISV